MQKRVVVIKRRGKRRGLGGACYHSYIPESHDFWIRRIDLLHLFGAEAQAKKEAERRQIETSRKIKEQQDRTWEEELKQRKEIIRDILHGRRKIDRQTYSIARSIEHQSIEYLRYLMKREEEKEEILRRFEDYL